MTTRLIRFTAAALAGLTLNLVLPPPLHAQSAAARYTAAKAREDKVRTAIAATAPTAPTSARTPVITEARAVIAAYEALVRAYRASGYADNALFNAASLAEALHDRFGLTTDRDAALRLYKRLRAEYPTAPLARQTPAPIARLEQMAAANAPVAPPMDVPAVAAPGAPVAAPGAAIAGGPRAPATLTAIERSVAADLVRVTLVLDREVSFHEESLTGPARVFLDLRNVEAAPDLRDAVLRYPSKIVRQIRIGRHPHATRVVLDFEEVGRHSVYTLYNPFRIVIDAEPPAFAAEAVEPRAAPMPPVSVAEPPVVASVIPAPIAADTTADKPVVLSAPVVPRGNVAGGFSIARQLGLGVSRIVIDPGHGGHDPGAQVRGLNEADLTLDIALRLEKLLQKVPGLEVVLTRRTDVYLSLDERTAIANREGADLFLSIHANTSRNLNASGVETYYLSFAASPEAEAVAARENASYASEMHKLPDIIRAITLNNKLDESRDFAGMVQEALVTRLRPSNQSLTNRGVKKAPFVVLIGAEMPSVLAEVSFLTNKRDLQLLKTAAYKQRIAEALQAAVLRYRRSLKGSATASAQ
ncbi:MAG TPA: N-acetylmuramoyl-L-alanine amidase [Vicinamibacterales bacterium]|nr:N-acetylmuramoyl-L-alanine amidase [Vicinamibacterales bacterium]